MGRHYCPLSALMFLSSLETKASTKPKNKKTKNHELKSKWIHSQGSVSRFLWSPSPRGGETHCHLSLKNTFFVFWFFFLNYILLNRCFHCGEKKNCFSLFTFPPNIKHTLHYREVHYRDLCFLFSVFSPFSGATL